jgi:hypothetical protein
LHPQPAAAQEDDDGAQGTDSVTLNLVNFRPQAAKTVLGDVLGVNTIIPPSRKT